MEPAAAPAAAPVGRTQGGGKVAGQQSQTPGAIKKREKRAAAKQQAQAQSQAELDADRNRIMGNFTDSVERHKQRMVAEAFQRGELSIFRQR